MGSPYLNSGEAIVLTTHRVSADTVTYDVMLTTERIFLIDNRNVRFEPQIIPLFGILSVHGGKTPAQEPVITLLFRTSEEAVGRQPINLVFSQNPNENRKPERDDWVRSLIQLSITQHERETVPETSVIPEVTGGRGLRPTARHGVAPEMVRPLSNVVIRERLPAPVTVIPEEVGEVGNIPGREAAVLPLRDESPVPEEPATDITPVRGTSPHKPAPPARVIIPQIIEELLPEKKIPSPKYGQEPAPAAGLDPEALFRTIPTAARSMTVTEERRPSQHPVAVTIPEPASDEITPVVAEHGEVPEIIKALHTGATEPVIPEQPDAEITDTLPEIIKALRTGATEPVTPEQSDAETPDTLPEPVPDNGDAADNGIPGFPEPSTVIQIWEQEPVSNPTPDKEFEEEPATPENPPVRHPIPPAREFRPLKTTLAYAAVLLLFIALIVAGAVLLLPPPGQTDNPVTPTPPIVLVTTATPETVQPTTLIPDTVPPATTRIATPVPSLPVTSVPQEGVWVRVNCTSEYFGTLGNTGIMRQVSGTGDNFYKVLRSDRPVQVSVQKKDNSGALLAVAIYRNGTLISTRSVTSPMGTVDMLIDPVTALAPGLFANDVLPAQTGDQAGLENY